MGDCNPLGFKDHRPFSGFSDELVYGISTTGATVHISDVVRGLRCDCTCPACGLTVIAKKGTKQTHHFAHFSQKATCSHVAETNAHIWAKEVLEREKKLIIPAVFAYCDGQTELVSPERIYEFVSARLEQRLESIVPDVILVTKAGAQLIVEVRVTHPCDEAKIQKLKADRHSAIEIDLRQYRTSTDREAVERGLLTNAPREWLSNAKQALFDQRLCDRLANEADRKAKEAEARATRIAATAAKRLRREQEEQERTVKQLIAAIQTHTPTLRNLPPTVDQMLKDFSDVPWSQRNEIGFGVHSFVWKAELAMHFLTPPRAMDYHWSEQISVELALRTIRHYVLPTFRRQFSGAVRDRLREEWPNHRLPTEAIEDFLDALVGAGYLKLDRIGLYSISEEYADQLSERERRRQAYEHRLRDIRRRVEATLSRLPASERKDLNLDTWLSTKLSEYGADPDTLCQQGDEAYRDFERAIKCVELMSEGGPITANLLNLPLTGVVTRAESRQRDIREQAASQRRLSLFEAAKLALGDDANTWLSGPSELDDELTRIDQAGLDDSSYQLTRRFLEKAAAARQAAIDARNEASLRQADLREACKKVFDQEHLDLFLRAAHPRLGKSPLEYCVDSRTLQQCLSLLPRARRG